MSTNRITHLGYAAVSEGKVYLVQPPSALAKVPVRLSAGIGLVYFATSLILLRTGGESKQFYLPLLGIAAAFGVFVYRTVTLAAGWMYRRRLRAYVRQGVVVFVPLDLLRHAERLHEKQGRKLAAAFFDADLEKTRLLVETYQQEGFSPKVKKILHNFENKLTSKNRSRYNQKGKLRKTKGT